MFVLKPANFLSNCKLCKLLGYSSTYSNKNNIVTHSKFTIEEQEKILNTLNNCNAEQLSRFDVSQSRIKNMVKWKVKEGPFKSLEEVLEVEGLGIKVFERLCESIVTDAPVSRTNGAAKSRRQYLIPVLSNEETLDSAVGFHLGVNGISWAKLSVAGNRLSNWNYIDFSSNVKKMLPFDTFKLALRILNEIPTGNAYIFEASANIAPQSNKQSSFITSYNQQLELASMLFALINTSPKHNLYLSNIGDESNAIYYLKANLSARLFKTLVGSERVSSTTSVSNILQKSTECRQCSRVNVDNDFQQHYFLQSPVVREILGQSLLVIVTFMDLCVYKNPKSLESVMPGKR